MLRALSAQLASLELKVDRAVQLRDSESAMSEIGPALALVIFTDNRVALTDAVERDGPAGASEQFVWDVRSKDVQTPDALAWLAAPSRLGGCIGTLHLLDARGQRLDTVLPSDHKLS